MGVRWIVAFGLCVVSVTACNGDDASSPTTDPLPTIPPALTVVPVGPPLVNEIAAAVEALEAELGGPQQYFEINATSRLVNLFVALNNATVAQPWVYLDGELSSSEGLDAQGNTFAAEAMSFDPDQVLDGVQTELPTSNLDLFLVEGGADGAVRYTVVVSSSTAGQLLVVVEADGTVVSADPN